MSQEITIIVAIDTHGALEANSLKDNIYLIDNQRTDGSEGEGTNHLVTVINGSHWVDGSQVADIVLNWLICPLDALPRTLPRNYISHRSKQIDNNLLSSIREFGEKDKKINTVINDFNLIKESVIKNEDSSLVDLGVKMLNVYGDAYRIGDDYSNLSILFPQVSNITGEAIDKKVLFAAQYGTPIPIKEGWYWSSTVDINKSGIYNYTLHITLYKLDDNNNWIPTLMTHEAQIRVINEPQVNGFTNAGIGYLPII